MKRFVLLVALLAFAGCGEKTINSGKLEGDIADDAQKEGLVLDDVECPSPKVDEGNRFDCTVSVNGEKRKLEVVQRAHGAVGYDLGPLVRFEAGSDAGGDEAAVRFVIDAVNGDVTALCDYATKAYRRELGGDGCVKRVVKKYAKPMRDYRVVVRRNTATARGTGRVVTVKRQRDGSWLIVRVRAQ